jgi:glycosyltransferase involved in cell wall biosynthesis
MTETTPETICFSVFIPVWNGGRWLPRAISSLLEQTYPHWELVIGDNASDDDLGAIVRQFKDPRIRYHRWSDHTEIFENYNRTMQLCRFEWIQLLCCDDRLLPTCLERLASRIAAARPTNRLAMVIGAARRVDAEGRPADAAYYGFAGRALVPDGTHDAAAWLRLSTQPGVTPWNFGAVAISRRVLTESGGFFRPEIGLCSDVEATVRLAAYGDVAYMNDELMEYTVRGDSDSSSRATRNRAVGDLLTPMGLALLSGLRAHQERREVSHEEQQRVYDAVARFQLQRAIQHRYLAGGRGRWRGTAPDILRAVTYSPRTVLRPRGLLQAVAAMVLPTEPLQRVRTALMARRYARA